jgi:hypothetical protein
MRPTRLITALLAVLAVLGASLSTTSSAQAAEGTAAKARSAHVFRSLSAAEVRNTGKFYVKGQVITYKNRAVKLQKAACKKGCAYKPYAAQRTSKAGRFFIKFDGRIGSCFRVYVPATKTRKATFRGKWCIVRA